MDLNEITSRLGDFTQDCILITEAEPVDQPGPRIVWCNRSFTEMSGYTLEELLGKTPRIFQGPDTSRETAREIGEGLRAWRPVRAEIKNYTKAGRPFWVDLSIVPVADDNGWYRYWVSVQRDVTERKELDLALFARNNALEKAQARLERERKVVAGIAAVAEYAEDLITITDLQFRIVWANPAFLRRANFALEDLVGLSHCDVVDKQGVNYSSRAAAIQAVLRGQYEPGYVRNTAKGGEEFWTDVRISVQRDDQGRPHRFVVVERDVTEKRAMMLELERHRDHLREMVEERTETIRRQSEELAAALDAEKELNGLQRQFVSMVSHELRTPLAIIDGKAYQLARRAEQVTPEKIQESCADIRRAIRRLTDLMESVLQSAKLEQGGIDYNPAPTNLAELLAEACASAAEVFPTHEIRFEASDDLTEVPCDPTLMRQVVSNLLSNAAKYSDPGALIRVRAGRDAQDGSVRLEVADSGVGIPSEELAQLFTRFFRASTSVGRPGTGLGLHLVNHFVKLHGGHMAVESDTGVGTTFTVVLPDADAAARRVA